MEFFTCPTPDGKEEIYLIPQTTGEQDWLKVLFSVIMHKRLAMLEPISDLPNIAQLSSRPKKKRKAQTLDEPECLDACDTDPEPNITLPPSQEAVTPEEWPYTLIGRSNFRKALADTRRMLFTASVPFNPLNLAVTLDSSQQLATLKATHNSVVDQLDRNGYTEYPATPTRFSIALRSMIEQTTHEITEATKAAPTDTTPEEV